MTPLLGLALAIVVTILVAGLIVWGIKAFPWIDAGFKQAAIVVIIVLAGIWIIYQLVPMVHRLTH